jgi:DNA-binding MarR family transcriptional regulator
MPKLKKIGSTKTMRALTLWRGVTQTALEQMPIDLSARQTSILLTVHLTPGPHSIKSLSKYLSISKPATCRAIDVLENAKLVRRAEDKKDKRTVVILPAAKGSEYLRTFADIIVSVSKEAA